MRTLCILLATLLLAPPSFAGKRVDIQSTLATAEQAAQVDPADAVPILQDAVERAKGTDRDELGLHLAEYLRLSGSTDRAAAKFLTLVDDLRGPLRDAARLGHALSSAVTNPTAETLEILRVIPNGAGLKTMNADRHLVLALDAAEQNDTAAAVRHARQALEAARGTRQAAMVTERIRGAISSEDAPDLVPPPEATPIEKAAQLLDAGDREGARAAAERVLASGPTEDDAYAARYLLKRVDGALVNPGKIGLLLPQSGKYAAVAKQVREALDFGYGRGAAKRRLVAADTGEDAASAVAALERLVLEEGVIAVVGPLRRDLTLDVAKAANALGVPLISLSKAIGATDERQWVFQALPSPREQARALAQFVMEKRAMTSFAIFAPDNAYGRTGAEAFRAAVEERGGTITVEEFYDAAATDLIPFAKTLGRKDYEARAEEFRELKKEIEKKGGNPKKAVLPPVIDFQGLFLPDSYNRVAVAVAGLAYEEFPIGHFQTVKDGPTIPMLGLSSWNNAKLVVRGGPYVRDSIFVDAWYEDPEAPSAFVERYREERGRTPRTLEVLASIVGETLAAIADDPASTRADLRDALLGVSIGDTPTGADSFDEERILTNRIRVLSISKDAIYPIDTDDASQPEEGSSPQ